MSMSRDFNHNQTSKKSSPGEDKLFPKGGGGSVNKGLANRETGAGSPNDHGMNTQGPNQVPRPHPKGKVGGTRFRWG